MKHLRSIGEMAVVAIHEGKKLRSKLDNRGKTCMLVGYADDHSGDAYRFLNINTKRSIMSRDARRLNIIWKHYRMKSIYAKKQVELFLDEEERSIQEGPEQGENRIEGDGINTPAQRKLGLDIGMIGDREETLGRTRSQTKEMSSPRNESMERADHTMEDWIQETCLISAVTSRPTEPNTFQEAWHCQKEKEINNWRTDIRKEMRSMIDREVWRKPERKKIPNNRRLIGNKRVFKIKRDGTYRARLVALGYRQLPGVDTPGKLYQGRIKFFSAKKRFGFVVMEEGGDNLKTEDYFFHESHVPDDMIRKLRVGDQVSFHLTEDSCTAGRWSATLQSFASSNPLMH